MGAACDFQQARVSEVPHGGLGACCGCMTRHDTPCSCTNIWLQGVRETRSKRDTIHYSIISSQIEEKLSQFKINCFRHL